MKLRPDIMRAAQQSIRKLMMRQILELETAIAHMQSAGYDLSDEMDKEHRRILGDMRTLLQGMHKEVNDLNKELDEAHEDLTTEK
jgi:hypothetical protein